MNVVAVPGLLVDEVLVPIVGGLVDDDHVLFMVELGDVEEPPV